MKYKIYDNRKGIGIDDAVPLIIFIFIAVFGIFIFNISEKVKSENLVEDIQIQKDILEGHEILMVYLTTSDVQMNNKADLISQSYTEKNYENLKKDLKEHFDKKLAYLPLWYIDIIDQSGNNIFSIQSTNYYSGYEQSKVAEVGFVLIPVYGLESQYIRIKLFFGK